MKEYKMIDIRHVYLTNDLYGGYAFTEVYDDGDVREEMKGSTSYANPYEVLEVAKKAGVKHIHLAGDSWKRIGQKGWGQKVTIKQAEKLLKKLKAHRNSVEWGSGKNKYPSGVAIV